MTWTQIKQSLTMFKGYINMEALIVDVETIYTLV